MDRDALTSPPSEPSGEAAARGRLDAAGAAGAVGPAADRPPPTGAPAEKELLCTLCGLRACWQ